MWDTLLLQDSGGVWLGRITKCREDLNIYDPNAYPLASTVFTPFFTPERVPTQLETAADALHATD